MSCHVLVSKHIWYKKSIWHTARSLLLDSRSRVSMSNFEFKVFCLWLLLLESALGERSMKSFQSELATIIHALARIFISSIGLFSNLGTSRYCRSLWFSILSTMQGCHKRTVVLRMGMLVWVGYRYGCFQHSAYTCAPILHSVWWQIQFKEKCRS